MLPSSSPASGAAGKPAPLQSDQEPAPHLRTPYLIRFGPELLPGCGGVN